MIHHLGVAVKRYLAKISHSILTELELSPDIVKTEWETDFLS